MKFTKKKNWLLLLSLLYFPLMQGCSYFGGATRSGESVIPEVAGQGVSNKQTDKESTGEQPKVRVADENEKPATPLPGNGRGNDKTQTPGPPQQSSSIQNSQGKDQGKDRGKKNGQKTEGDGGSVGGSSTTDVLNKQTDNKSTGKQSKVVGKNEKQLVTPGASPTVNGSGNDKQQTSDPQQQSSNPPKDSGKEKIESRSPSTGRTGTTHSPGETTTTEETQQYPLIKGVEVKYYYRPSEQYGFLKSWKETIPLKTGDEYIIRFESPVDCYIYVYKVGEHDNITDLLESFPNQKGRSFEKNQKHTLPSGEDVFILDKRDAPGEDEIYFLAFEKPNKDLGNLYQSLSKARQSKAAEKRSQRKITREMLNKLNVVQPFFFEHQP